MFKTFGNTKAVFVNQDEGMFVALPITIDSTVLTLETETRNGRTYAIAGSLVKDGNSVRGILAEEYDITDGPVAGRVVLEGYAWAERLTAEALAAASDLPRIVVMPYDYVSFKLESVDTAAHKAVIKIKNGGKFKSTIATSDLTVSSLTASAVALNTAKDELTITFSAAGTGSLSAIALGKIEGISANAIVKGLPISLTV